jgi:FixJ family two-component response regulator
MANVIIVGGSDETRLLLRGLLRLHRQRVMGEGSTPEFLKSLSAPTEPTVLLLDVDLELPEWLAAVRQTIDRINAMSGVLLTPSRSSRVEELARQAGISRLVRRPFAVHELIEAVSPESGASTPPGPPTPTGPPPG